MHLDGAIHYIETAAELLGNVKSGWLEPPAVKCDDLSIEVCRTIEDSQNHLGNLLWSTNFMFLESASEGNPLYFFEQRFGNHLIGFPVLAVAVLAVMYGPLTVWQRCRAKREC